MGSDWNPDTTNNPYMEYYVSSSFWFYHFQILFSVKKGCLYVEIFIIKNFLTRSSDSYLWITYPAFVCVSKMWVTTAKFSEKSFPETVSPMGYASEMALW